MKKIIIYLLFIVTVIISSCTKENYNTSSDAKLRFSMDTVMFDTVFTTIGSTTSKFKVYNPYDSYVTISSIKIAKGSESNYRLNIDGITTNSVENIDIAPKDSLYIFVEVTVDPNRDDMIELDSIIFITNNVVQDVKLVAFGQDVHLVNGEIFYNDTTWTNDKPFLIYNSMLVDETMTLTIQQGTQLYFHYGSGMLVKGTLKVNGTLAEPVTFQGDRLETGYDDLPGQWGAYISDDNGNIQLLGAIHLLQGSKDNIINFAEIKNAMIGIRVDTLANINETTLTISNSKIQNMSVIGLFGLGTTIKASNCVFSNCGQSAVSFSLGGDYNFYHCTIDNRWSYSNRTNPSLVLNNYYLDINGTVQIRPLLNAYFGNCIIYGGNDMELELDSFPNVGNFNYTFDHCLMKLDEDFNSSNEHFISLIKNQSPKFVSTVDDVDLSLLETSPAIGTGSIDIANLFPLDINEQNRLSDNAPDLGAYEKID